MTALEAAAMVVAGWLIGGIAGWVIGGIISRSLFRRLDR